MLVLNRKRGESICIAGNIEVTVLEVRSGRVKLGIEGPRVISIFRQEIPRKVHNAQKVRLQSAAPL